MNRHPYLRAYMAGITVPTVFLLVIMSVFTMTRHIYNVPIPFERVIVFPMAVVPNLWGLWNVLWVWLLARRLSIGLFGALLPLLLAPTGFAVARAVDFAIPSFLASAFPVGLPVAVAVYYLAWKHVVGFFNELLGIA